MAAGGRVFRLAGLALGPSLRTRGVNALIACAESYSLFTCSHCASKHELSTFGCQKDAISGMQCVTCDKVAASTQKGKEALHK
jgi:hypothetical protein